jgi:YVTN family beta-propeller protein
LKARGAVRTLIFGVVGLLAVATGTLLVWAQSAPLQSTPGTLADGSTLLPNGWRLMPAGRHLGLSDLPLNVVQTPDSRFLIVTNNGLMAPSLTIIDIASWTIKSTVPLDQAWYGLVWHPDGTKLYLAGAAKNTVQEFGYASGVLTLARTFLLPPVTGQGFAGGLSITPNGKTLFVTRVFSQDLSSIDVASGQVLKTIKLPAEPYTSLVSNDGKSLFVSIWGDAGVQTYSTQSLEFLDAFETDEHPSALLLSADGRRLFVTCGSGSSVWTYDTLAHQVIEQISTSLYPLAPLTSTPNSLSLSPDGKTLIVANADNNAVAVVNVTNNARSIVTGFIPTGWYPTGAIFSRDGTQIFVLSGKGLVPAPNMNNNGMELRVRGAVSIVPTPDAAALADSTRRVYALTPYTDAALLAPANAPAGTAIPRAVGGPSPIKHVFYIIRENRTYDCVFGDLKQGNGSPQLTLFGRDVTPNAHAIAENFVLMDNFYVDADVSYDGHNFSMAAYATDVIEKVWQTYYAHRGAMYIGEGGWFMRNPFGNVTAPPQGYLWDYAQRANVTVRSYGEFAENTSRTASGDVTVTASVPGLAGLVAPAFAAFDLTITDQKRVDVWAQEFAAYVKNGQLPQLSIIRLGNDHTNGTVPGTPTPRAMVADNDLALGRVVEAISNSVYWKDSAIFVLEDDAQSGADHVDSHRSVALVASPFAKRAFVDHTFYSTSGMLRTIELVLGLGPMSQYDAAAAPMYNAFQGTANLAPYSHLVPLNPLNEVNLSGALGASLSRSMNFADADLTPEDALNEVIWRSVKGPGMQVPPPKHSILVSR